MKKLVYRLIVLSLMFAVINNAANAADVGFIDPRLTKVLVDLGNLFDDVHAKEWTLDIAMAEFSNEDYNTTPYTTQYPWDVDPWDQYAWDTSHEAWDTISRSRRDIVRDLQLINKAISTNKTRNLLKHYKSLIYTRYGWKYVN